MLLPLLSGARPLAMAAAPMLCAAAPHLKSLPASCTARHLITRVTTAGAETCNALATTATATTPTTPTTPTTTAQAGRPRRPLLLLLPPQFSAATPHRRFMATTTSTNNNDTPEKNSNDNKPAVEALLAEAHALAAQHPSSAVLPALRALAPDLAAAAPSLTPKQLAALLPVLARAGLSHAAFRDAACAALVPRLDELSPDEAAGAAFSLARGLGHDQELLSAVVERAARDPSAFSPASLSKLLWSCARLSYMHAALPALLEHVVGACCGGAADGAEAVAELAHAAGALDWGDDRLHNAVASYASTHPHAFDGHGLAKLLSGLVGVGYDDPPLFDKLAARAAEFAARGELAPADCARLAWALGEGGFWSAPLLAAISEHMLAPAGRLAAFSPAELQTVVRAANKLNYCSPAIAAAAAALTDRLLPCLEPLPPDDDGHAPGVSAIDHPWTPMSSPPPPPPPSHHHHHHP